MNIIQELEKEQIASLNKDIPTFDPGDTVQVNVKVVEGTRERVQAFEGVCIARGGEGLNESFTVRKISYGEGVERVFPVHGPLIDSIKVIRRGRVFVVRSFTIFVAVAVNRLVLPSVRINGLKSPPPNKATAPDFIWQQRETRAGKAERLIARFFV